MAGHLASRIGIKVELHAGAAGGVTARIEIPESLLVDEALAAPQPMAMPAAPSLAPAGEFDHDDHAAPVAPAATASLTTLTPLPLRLPMTPREHVNGSGAADADPFFEREPASARDEHRENGFAPEPPAAPAPEHDDTPGFGGLAPVTARNDDGTHADATNGNRTPSGLVKRVPGAQPPGMPAPFADSISSLVRNEEDSPVATSSPEDVSNFLADFAFGVDRGLAEASEPDTHDSRENW